MSESVRRQAIFDGVGGIRDEYIEEAAATLRPIRKSLFRAAAAAAAVVLLLAIPAIWNILNPAQQVEPFFTIKVCADTFPDSYDEDWYWSSYVDDTKVHRLFGDHSTFHLQIRVNKDEDITPLNTYTVVEYDNQQVSYSSGGTDNLHIFLSSGENGNQIYVNGIAGWFDKPTELKISVYKYNTDRTDSILLQTETVLVTPNGEEYQIEVIDSYINK